jgi:hypothetical protein
MISGDPDLLAKFAAKISLVAANHGPKNFRHGESAASNRTDIKRPPTAHFSAILTSRLQPALC